MKNGLKWVLLMFFVIGGSTVMAQQIKLGYINSQEIFSVMPERDSAAVKLEAFRNELVEQLELVEVEYNEKMADLQKNYSTYNESVLNMRQKQLNDIRARLEEMNTQAEQDLQQQQYTLMNPVIEKLNNAIKKVGKENNFTAVFDVSSGAMVYHDESSMTDMGPLVKKELNIQ